MVSLRRRRDGEVGGDMKQGWPAHTAFGEKRQTMLQRMIGLALLLSALACSANSPWWSNSAPVDPACRKFMLPTPQGISTPRLLKRVTPRPPLRGSGSFAGYVCVQSTLNVEGKLVDITVVATDSQIFADAVVDALSQWRFSPAVRDGTPVEIPISLSFSYTRNGQ